jgi:hypothetical protein
MEISKQTKFTLSVETIVLLVGGIISLMGVWYSLKMEVEEAKNLPATVVTKTEWDLKDQLIRESVLSTQKQVEEINKRLYRIEEKLTK